MNSDSPNGLNLADEGCEDMLYDVLAIRDFCWTDLGCEQVPDATTLLGFRHLLEQHQLGGVLFTKMRELAHANGMKVCARPIVDATWIVPTLDQESGEEPRSGYASPP